MEKRRRHDECKEGHGGCEVILGRTCDGPKRKKAMVVFKDGVKVASDATKVLSDMGKSIRFERGLTMWAILALVISLIINIWLILGTRSNVLGLLSMGEGALWQIQ